MNKPPVRTEDATYVLETEAQVRAFAHPLRQRILDLLARNELTNKEIADAVGKPPGNTHHHVTTLQRAGLIRQTRSRQYRGVVERYYVAAAHRFVLASASHGEAQKITVAALQAASGRLADEAVEDGTGVVRLLSETRWLSDGDIQRLDELLGELRQLMTASEAAQPRSGRRIAVFALAQELVIQDEPSGASTPGAGDE